MAYLFKHTVVLPILALIYVLLPSSTVSEYMQTPIVKFLSHMGSFLRPVGRGVWGVRTHPPLPWAKKVRLMGSQKISNDTK